MSASPRGPKTWNGRTRLDQTDLKQIGVRIPTPLRTKLRTAARQNKITVNHEINQRLERSFAKTLEPAG
jgi:hypothetical protein